jgi:5S rRNA maturation endonuclease (ribonuclease M5)
MFDINKLNILSEKIVSRLDEILDCLGVRVRKCGNSYRQNECVIHGGDNPTALVIYENENQMPVWKCFSHHCEQFFSCSLVGLIRGILSHQKNNWTYPNDEMVSLADTIKFIENCLNENYEDIKVNIEEAEKAEFIRLAQIYKNKSPIISDVLRENVIKTLEIPAPYFLNRGFSAKILEKYDVGLDVNPHSNTYNRIVVPVYDNQYQYVVGNTSRSIYDKCIMCNTYHNPLDRCPLKEDKSKFMKWKHSYGFSTKDHLYNYWYSYNHIKQNKVVILVESPGNVWRLEEAGIYTSLATFGSSLSSYQHSLLNRTNALTAILVADNDSAGLRFMEQLDNKLKNTYNIVKFVPNKPDIGEMTVDEISKEFLPLYQNCVSKCKF